jgi:hypothetical protein
MKNIEVDPEDTLRPEYKRSDFEEIIRGKYATIQVDFHQLTGALFACIGEDEGVKFMHHSTDNRLANHKSGDWTYEFDNGNQVTLRYWLDSLKNVSEEISNPSCVMTPKERSELQGALLEGVKKLKAKVSDRE